MPDMDLVDDCSDTDLKRYIENAVEVDPERPVLVDKYLDRADELDVDALGDKDGNCTICGIMQHIEQAGVHSGDCLHPRHAWPCLAFSPPVHHHLGDCGRYGVHWGDAAQDLSGLHQTGALEALMQIPCK